MLSSLVIMNIYFLQNNLNYLYEKFLNVLDLLFKKNNINIKLICKFQFC